MNRPAVFFDRDGTLIESVPYVSDPARVGLIPGVPEALLELKQMGFTLVVITNQSGVARGLHSEADVIAVNERMEELILSAGGPALDGTYYCPYFAGGSVPEYSLDSNLRKPKPGMVHKAREDLGIDLAHSFLVGDSLEADIPLGLDLGLGVIYFNSRRTLERPAGVIAETGDFREIPGIIRGRISAG